MYYFSYSWHIFRNTLNKLKKNFFILIIHSCLIIFLLFCKNSSLTEGKFKICNIFLVCQWDIVIIKYRRVTSIELQVWYEKSIFTCIMRLHSIKGRHLTFCSEGRRNVNPAKLAPRPYWYRGDESKSIKQISTDYVFHETLVLIIHNARCENSFTFHNVKLPAYFIFWFLRRYDWDYKTKITNLIGDIKTNIVLICASITLNNSLKLQLLIHRVNKKYHFFLVLKSEIYVTSIECKWIKRWWLSTNHYI